MGDVVNGKEFMNLVFDYFSLSGSELDNEFSNKYGLDAKDQVELRLNWATRKAYQDVRCADCGSHPSGRVLDQTTKENVR